MITSVEVLNTCFRPARISSASPAKSGPRWSMVGISIARSTRSGTLVGPGICRKWRPAGVGIKKYHTIQVDSKHFRGNHTHLSGSALPHLHDPRGYNHRPIFLHRYDSRSLIDTFGTKRNTTITARQTDTAFYITSVTVEFSSFFLPFCFPLSIKSYKNLMMLEPMKPRP